MNFQELKKRSKELMMTAKPSPVSIGLLFVTIVIVLNTLSTNVLTKNISQTMITKYQALLERGDYEGIADMADEVMPDGKQSGLDVIIGFLIEIVSFGFTIYTVNIIRNNGEACAGNLLDGFGYVLKLFLYGLLLSLILTAGFLLFIVPGFIFLYSYRQTKYFMIDNPQMNVVECMKNSRLMMKGHKWELFTLDVSFIGWILLSVLTPTRIWSDPYRGFAYALYYENLLKMSDDYTEVI